MINSYYVYYIVIGVFVSIVSIFLSKEKIEKRIEVLPVEFRPFVFYTAFIMTIFIWPASIVFELIDSFKALKNKNG